MPFIFLDRDGVINYDSEAYIKSPEEWKPIPGSLAALAALNRVGYRVIVVSNQSGIARGYYTEKTLQAIHRKMLRALHAVGGTIEQIYFCPHEAKDHCDCRKPKIGLFKEAAKDFSIDLSQSVFIGDKYIDYQTALAAGCRFILVQTGYGKKTLLEHPELLMQVPVAVDLADAVNRLLVNA